MVTAEQGENTELVIGLVGPIGTNLKAVKKVFAENLKCAGYSVEEIKISTDVIEEVCGKKVFPSKAERYEGLIEAGNDLRKRAKEDSDFDGDPNAILAYGVADVIYKGRPKTEPGDSSHQPAPKFSTAYIVDSLKRPEEVEWLRKVYPNGFILVGVFESEEERKNNLCGPVGETMKPERADQLIETDRNEKEKTHGQRVEKTFQLSDFFLHFKSAAPERLKCDVGRLVDLWFGQPNTTPTFDEYAMYMAFSASLRTADLSRQVGAVITKHNDILSTGANECPKAGGGLYWPLRADEVGGCIVDEVDGRDYMRGDDSNKKAVVAIVDEVMEIIEKIVATAKEKDPDVDEASIRKRLEKSTLGDLTEFGRVVHAEMEAILACARSNNSARNATLYCTTFPCHNCAKHIIAAGIQRVVYIEPYAKSRAFDFHPDAILRADPDLEREPEDKKVYFEPFVGVGPRRYLDLFSMKQGSGYRLVRKTPEGDKIDWNIGDSQLRLQMKPSSYLDSEDEASVIFRKFCDN